MLQGSASEGIGVSIVVITQTADTDAMRNATSIILEGLTIAVPLVTTMPQATGQDLVPWTTVGCQ